MSLTGDSINIQTTFNGNIETFNGVIVGSGIEAQTAFGPDFEVAIVDVDGDSFTIEIAPGGRIFQPTTLSVVISDLNWVDDPNGFITNIFDTTPSSGFTLENLVINNNGPGGIAPSSISFDINVPAPFIATISNTFNIITECFLTGTHILTNKGEIAVENLQIGDKVVTAEGKLEPIKWIGYQTVTPHQVKNPLRSYPILIKAGALGNKLPHRDLYVSPDHAIFFENILINAGALVNGISIIKTEPKSIFTYYHIELDNHALLLAEGASAESYLPQNEDRLTYENGAEYEKLYPHGSNLMLWPMDYPRISSWVKVPRHMRQKLNAIAQELGLVVRAA